VDVQKTPHRDGSFTVEVTLELPGGREGRGEARGHPIPESRMRAGARAALHALKALTDEELTLEVRGTKAVRAFDASVVIVAVRVRDDQGRRDLIGAVAAPDDDPIRGGVLAVLFALNRFLADKLQAAPSDPPE
jgi:hypothetical protein